MEKGKVYLVGAGPGDPELLTLKAARLIGAAGLDFVHRSVFNAFSSEVDSSSRQENAGIQKGRAVSVNGNSLKSLSHRFGCGPCRRCFIKGCELLFLQV